MLVPEIYTQSLCDIILPHPDLAKFFVCLFGNIEVQRLLGLVVGRVIYCTPVHPTWNISLGLVAVTYCAPILSNISEKLKIGVLLGGLVSAIFQSTASSCKLSTTLHYFCQHQNREDCHIVGWYDLW